MSVSTLLHRCQMEGVLIWIEGGRLKFKAAAPVPDGLLSELKAHRSQLFAHLSAGVVPGPVNQTISPSLMTREFDADGLVDWLREENLCLVMRDGSLCFTCADGREKGEPSESLRVFIEAHRVAIEMLLNVGQ